MFDILSIDLDGTLLSNRGQINDFDCKMIQKAKERGKVVVINTGRSKIGIPKVVDKLGKIDYFITSNGATITDYTGKTLYKNWIEQDIAIKVIDKVEKKNVVIETLIDGKWYMEDLKNLLHCVVDDERIIDYILNTREIHSDLKKIIVSVRYGVEKFTVSFRDVQQNAMLEYFETELAKYGLRFWTDKSHKLDIYAGNANKATSLKYLVENILDNSLKNVIAYGNDENDMEVFQCVGCAVAVRNAKKQLLDIADEVTYSNDSLGVGKSIYKKICSEEI